ncbi:pyridoxamine 5'-phosphate oxidase family protein [Actinotalea solisilvae]|uniref:pyridoxamine 5'-phosphate oxidase family protein n=1 Tax=Actinotalea solisilvae TaxID=2072922 RepID=UPI0018F12F08|nr:pyridoxamine 5'-phosphate oxidase family protein [Actinotalea solisilvae]
MQDEDVAVTAWTGDALSEDEAWDVLRREQLGRLAYHVGSEVDIAPVNHVVAGRRIVFRTAEGSKLFGVVVGKTVAFEVDRVEGDEARSVVVRGVAHELSADEVEAMDVQLRPWVGTEKPHVVAIEAVHVSGRRFTLSR